MNVKLIEKEISKLNEKAEKSNYNYQMTGEPRYLRAMENAEDMAEALNVALESSDIKQKYTTLKVDICAIARYDDPEKIATELKAVVKLMQRW